MQRSNLLNGLARPAEDVSMEGRANPSQPRSADTQHTYPRFSAIHGGQHKLYQGRYHAKG